MNQPLRFGIIPTNGRDCVDAAVASLLPQVDLLAVVEAGTDPVHRTYPSSVVRLTDDTGQMNISRWWNQGLDWAQATASALGKDQWDVAILNDDVEVSDTWMCYISDDVRALDCVAACSGGPNNAPIVHRTPGPVPLHTRLQGFAFMLVGESKLRANEAMRWYYSDDHLDWEARRAGGVVMFPGCHVQHKFPNGQVTGILNVYNTEDAEKFKRHWGMLPW